MILAPVSQQPRSLHMISACAAVPIRTNKLAMAGTIIDFIVVLLFLPFCAAEVQRDRLARVLATHIRTCLTPARQADCFCVNHPIGG